MQDRNSFEAGRRCRQAARLRPASTAFLGTTLLLLLTLTTTGCSRGVAWAAFAYDTETVETQRAGKPVFVYFRHWAVVECTEFEENVLKQSAALAATDDCYCVVLNFAADRKLADDWGVKQPPGVAVLGPDERVLAVRSGKMTVEQIVKMIETAKSEMAAQAQRGARP